MRLIDADALKVMLTLNPSLGLFEIIDIMPTVNQWVSAKDRFPNEDGEYLVAYSETVKTSKGDYLEIYYSVADYARNYGFSVPLVKGRYVFDELIAWMPIPEWDGDDMRGDDE